MTRSNLCAFTAPFADGETLGLRQPAAALPSQPAGAQADDRRSQTGGFASARAPRPGTSLETFTAAGCRTPRVSPFQSSRIVWAFCVLGCSIVASARAVEPTRLSSEQAAALFAAPKDKAATFAGDADLLATVTPAVVSVFPAKIVDEKDGVNPLDQFFNRDRAAPDRKEGDKSSRDNERVQGVGSGVVLSEDGWIVTNSHVVHFNNGKLADAISVEFPDRRRLDAEIIGADPLTDLALLKVKASGLPFLRIADSDQVRVGDAAYAVGNPFKIGITATKGMVSALRRSNLDLTTHGGYESYIQTDAAINPGNSGGVLANRHGQLVGINTAILGGVGRFNVGIGFAIPSNLVRNVISQLAETGKVERGFFGWQIEEPSRKEIEAAGLTTMAGAKLDQLLHRGPADVAGLKTGDIVIRAGGQPVMNRGDLRFITSLVKPGGQLEVTYQRSGKESNAVITATRTASQAASTSGFRVEGIGSIDFRKGRRGIEIVTIHDKQAAKTGLTKGMEIIEINGKPVTNLAEAEVAVVGGVNQVKARRGSDEMTLAIKFPLGAVEEEK